MARLSRMVGMVSTATVLRAIAGDSWIWARFRSSGGDIERWRRFDWLAMSDAITRAEDRLEGSRKSEDAKFSLSLRSCRRALEDLHG